MYTNSVQLVGNLVDAPDVQVTPSGVVRTRFRVASTERRRDPATGTWQDGESVFLDVTCWRRLAQHVGNSLRKGDGVVVLGRLRQWTAERDGVRRVMLEIEADTVAPDLQRGMATVARSRRPEGQESETTDAATGTADLPGGDVPGVHVPGVQIGAGDVDLDTGEILGTGAAVAEGEPAEGTSLAEAATSAAFDARPLVDAVG